MIDFLGVHWLAVIVAAVVGLVINYVWYLPSVMGTRWAATSGAALMTPTPMTLIATVIVQLVTAYVLTLFAGGIGLVNGIEVGVVAWVGFILTWAYSAYLFEKKSMDWLWINAGAALVSMAAMGAVVGTL